MWQVATPGLHCFTVHQSVAHLVTHRRSAPYPRLQRRAEGILLRFVEKTSCDTRALPQRTRPHHVLQMSASSEAIGPET